MQRINENAGAQSSENSSLMPFLLGRSNKSNKTEKEGSVSRSGRSPSDGGLSMVGEKIQGTEAKALGASLSSFGS